MESQQEAMHGWHDDRSRPLGVNNSSVRDTRPCPSGKPGRAAQPGGDVKPVSTWSVQRVGSDPAASHRGKRAPPLNGTDTLDLALENGQKAEVSR